MCLLTVVVNSSADHFWDYSEKCCILYSIAFWVEIGVAFRDACDRNECYWYCSDISYKVVKYNENLL